MPTPAVHKSHVVNVALHTEPSLTRQPRRQATCAWCRPDWPSIIELIDHVEAAHLYLTDAHQRNPNQGRPGPGVAGDRLRFDLRHQLSTQLGAERGS
jgi:hypothetical protein